MEKKTREQHLQNKTVFCSANSINELARLLRTDQRKLQLLATQPSYKAFAIPKKGGGERQIEAPAEDLKKTLSLLNRYLQSVYLFEKSAAAYGFVVGVKNDDDRRNVLTNARKHLGRPYLLNVDLEDFFHTISRERIVEVFQGPPFHFRRDLPDLLAGLTTYHQRLPMGAPTSPVLSNLACRGLDEQLQFYAQNMLWIYTRYADDMSFSSKQPIDEEKIVSICGIIEQAGFKINPRKLQRFGPEDPKVVTGLLVGATDIALAPDYLELLAQEINRLEEAMKVQNEQGHLTTRWLEQFKLQVRGRLNFAQFVLKKNDPAVSTLKDAFYRAINPPPEEFGAVSWRGFPYNF